MVNLSGTRLRQNLRPALLLPALLALLLAALTFTPPPPAIAQSPPDAPTGLSASGGVQSVTLSWNNPSDPSITGYEYNVNHNDTSTGNLSGWGPWTAISGSGASTTSHTFTGLTPGREYRYHVRAVNSGGPSAGAPNAAPWFVSASPSAPPPKPPAAPAGLSASGGVQSVTLSWNNPSDSSITGYEYNVNHNDTSTGNLSGWSRWTAIPGSGASTTSHTLTGLTPGREYRYHVRAVNSAGPGTGAPNAAPWFVSASPSAPKPKPTPTPTPAPKPNPPAAPTGLTATPGNGSVTLSWNDPSDASITRYEYNLNHNDTSTGNLSGWGPWTVIPGAGASTTSHTFTGLTNGKEYRYHLRAVNGGGSGGAAPNAAPWFVKAVPGNPVPFAPTGLSVTPGDGYLDISWNAVSHATGYDVRAKEAGASDWHTIANKITATSLRYVTARTIDYVAVRARNGNATGPWAELSRLPGHDWLNTVQSSGGVSIASASAQNQLTAPTGLTVTRENSVRNEKLYVNWSAVTGAQGYNLACAVSPGDNVPLTSWSWWHCGSVTSGSTTTFTVDDDLRGGITRDLSYGRSYAVAVRAVTTTPAQASPWTVSDDAHPARQISGSNPFSTSRADGSLTLSWIQPVLSTGYEIYCATIENGVLGADQLCADVETATFGSGRRVTATITSWTVDGTSYAVDNSKTYSLVVLTTNAWGTSPGKVVPTMNPYVTLTASNVSDDSATLTIANHTGNWYYKHTNTGATCDGPVSGTSQNLASLTGGTAYTYSAYSDSTCSTLLATAAQFTTQVSVDNLDKGPIFQWQCAISGNAECAVAFTTGPNAGGYTLTAITARFTAESNSSGNLGNLVVTLRDDDSGRPDTREYLASLTVGSNPVTAGDYRFTCDVAGCALSPNTTYFVVLSADAGSTTTYESYNWQSTENNDEDLNPAGNGWTLANGTDQRFGVIWQDEYSDTGKLKITARMNVGLTASNVAATTATLNIARHADAWYYKATSGPHTSCQGPVAAGTSSASLTGLTTNTSYTYSAYSDSGCTTGNLLATAAEFTTLNPSLTASNVTATTATLTIANHSGDWYYKHTNTGATCEGPVSGTSKNLTGLTASTSYTYSAYSDSGCTTGNLLATAAQFTTLTIVSVSTLSGADNGVVNVGGGSPKQRVAQAFTTGSNTGGYTLSSIAIAFRATVGSPKDLEVTLHAASGSNPNTGTTLATLSGSSPSTVGSYTYTCSSGCDLSASTTYFVYIKAPNSASGSHYLATFTSSDETLTPSGNGWSIADKGRLQYVGVGWFESGSHYRIAVTATAK